MNARRATAALDDVLWAVGLEDVTKVARSPLTRAGFDQMVSALVSALQQQTEPQRQAALTSVLRQLDHRWGSVSTEDRTRLIAAAMTQYVAGSGSLVAGTKTVLGQHMNTVAARSRAANIRSHQLKLPLEDPFGLVDPQVLEHARNSTALFIRDSRGVIAGRLSAVARGVVADGLAQGWDDRTIADELATTLRGTEAQQTKTYLTTVSSVFVARSRNYGTLRSFDQAGITAYEHVAVLDEMTCGVCRFMHGRTFDVRVSLDQYNAVAAGGPESVIALQPFMRTAKLPGGERVVAVPSGGALVPVADVDDDGVGRVDARGSFRPRVGDKAIQRMGCGCPVHPRCRCTVVPGATSVSVVSVPGAVSAPAVSPAGELAGTNLVNPTSTPSRTRRPRARPAPERFEVRVVRGRPLIGPPPPLHRSAEDAIADWVSRGAHNGNVTADDVRRVFGHKIPTLESIEQAWGGDDGRFVLRSVSTDGDAVRFAGIITDLAGQVRYDEDGVVRRFERQGRQLIAHHDYMVLLPRKNGQGPPEGIGSRIVRNAMALNSHLGVSAIEVHAAWRGRFAWPSMGFDWMPSRHSVAAETRRFAEFLRQHGVAKADEIAASAGEHPWLIGDYSDGTKHTVVDTSPGVPYGTTMALSLGKLFLYRSGMLYLRLNLTDASSPSFARARRLLEKFRS